MRIDIQAFGLRYRLLLIEMQLFNNLEEVKKVIHAEAVMEKSIAVEA